MIATRWGQAKQTDDADFRGLQTSPYIRISHEFTMMPNVFGAEYTFESLFLFCPPTPTPISLYMFSIYLKQKYMDCIKHGKANRCYS